MVKSYPRFLLLVACAIPPGASAQESPRLVWEIGTLDGPPETIWDRVVDAIVLGETVVAVDIAASTVRRYSSGGEYLGSAGGGRGQGPGEFAQPTSVSETPTGGFLVVDLAQSRFSEFDGDGRLVGTRPIEMPRGSFVQEVWALRDGWYAGVTALVGRGLDEDGNDLSEDSLRLVRWSDAGMDTLQAFPGNPIKFKISLSPRWQLGIWSTGAGGGVSAEGDSIVYFLNGVESTLSEYRVTADDWVESSRSRLPGVATHVGSEEQRELEQVWRKGREDELLELLETVRVPSLRPAWTGLIVDDGQVWLRRPGLSELSAEHFEEWVSLGPDRRPTGSVRFPPGVRVFDIEGRSAAAVRTDQLGVQYLQLYDVDVNR